MKVNCTSATSISDHLVECSDGRFGGASGLAVTVVNINKCKDCIDRKAKDNSQPSLYFDVSIHGKKAPTVQSQHRQVQKPRQNYTRAENVNPYNDPISLKIIENRLTICKSCDKNRDPLGKATGKWSIACDCRTCRAKPIISWSCPEGLWPTVKEESVDKVGVEYVTSKTSVEHVKIHIDAPANNDHKAPTGWERWPNVQTAHHHALQTHIETIEPYPGGQGTGVVICAGGKFFSTAYVTIRVLRHVGCNLPIQIWYLGRNNEKEQWMEDAVKGLDVEWVDGDSVAKKHPCRILNGWELKSFAVLHTKFKEVLSLDADSYPIRNPTYLFDDETYLARGSMFFPDAANEDVHSWSKGRGLPDYRVVFGLRPVHEPSFESGQFLVDREKCWKELHAAWWLNDHSDFFYRIAYGDKESFHLAWRFCGTEYAMPSKRWVMNNPPTDNRSTWAHTMQQHDMKGDPIFYHRCGAKFQLGTDTSFMTPQNWLGVRNDNMLHEDFCWSALKDLEQMRNNSILFQRAA